VATAGAPAGAIARRTGIGSAGRAVRMARKLTGHPRSVPKVVSIACSINPGTPSAR
jgi:hypothetical protein